jgi:hypothetical protein
MMMENNAQGSNPFLTSGHIGGRDYLAELLCAQTVEWGNRNRRQEDIMGFGRGLLLWLIGIPIPIIILLALFWHH